MQKYFWSIPTVAVLSNTQDAGKTRIEYDGSVFPESGPVMDGSAPPPTNTGLQLTAIYFSGDELGADVLRVKPNYAVIADGNKMAGSGNDQPPIRYGTVPKPDGQNYMETSNPEHPHFAQTGTPPPVTTPPPVQTTPPPVVKPPQPLPPGGEGAGGKYLGVKQMPWPAAQADLDIVMGGADWVDIEMTVDPALMYDAEHVGMWKAIEFNGAVIMRRLQVWINGAGVYGMNPDEPLGTAPTVSYTVGGTTGECNPKPSDKILVRIENHGMPSEKGNCRFQNLSPSRY